MPRMWNPSAIRDTQLFDSGPYLFTIESLEEGATRAGAFAYKAQLRCVEGKAEFIGLVKFETFTMGTDMDPAWENEETVGPGARGWKNFIKSTLGLSSEEMDERRDVDALRLEANGGTVGGIVNKALDKGGVMRDNIDRWYPAVAPAEMAKQSLAKGAQQSPIATRVQTPKASAGAAPAVPKATAKPDPPVKCGVCNEQVLRSQFGAHVTAHES